MDSIENILTISQIIDKKQRFHVVRDGETPPLVPTASVCKLCNGVGYRRENVPYGHPNFGKALECECKLAEQKKRLQQRLVADSGILSLALFETASFDSFDQSLPGVFDAHYHASLFAHDPSGWLILEGPYGCGKTHLAVAIAKARINAGDTIIVQTVPDLLDHLRSAFAPNSAQNYSELFETMRNVDLLILDDYGAQSDTPWALEKLFQLLNYRYNKALATVITSNDLKSGDARLYSRMHDKRLVRKIDMEQARDYRVYGDEE